MKNIFVFDVEATSLHGTAFAVGAVVIDKNGVIIDQFSLLSTKSIPLVNFWVYENVLPTIQNMPTCETDLELRNKFYDFYVKHKETCDIWSDCNWPVETNFLSQIVNDDLQNREFNMPYPLKDVSTIIDVNIDRMDFCKKMGITGFLKHNPLDDAKASGIIIFNHLHFLNLDRTQIEAINKDKLSGKNLLYPNNQQPTTNT